MTFIVLERYFAIQTLGYLWTDTIFQQILQENFIYNQCILPDTW